MSFLSQLNTDQPGLQELGKNGPWALMVGFLLWQIIKAWNGDRAEVTQLLGEFKTALNDLTREIHRLAEIQGSLMRGQSGKPPE